MRRELFPRTTGSGFDPISPATVAADMTIGFVLDAPRAARVVAQHAVDPGLPGLSLELPNEDPDRSCFGTGSMISGCWLTECSPAQKCGSPFGLIQPLSYGPPPACHRSDTLNDHLPPYPLIAVYRLRRHKLIHVATHREIQHRDPILSPKAATGGVESNTLHVTVMVVRDENPGVGSARIVPVVPHERPTR